LLKLSTFPFSEICIIFQDTDIILWDVVAEAGLHRLTGHKGIVTQICFLEKYNVLVSGSKDTFVKFWDLDTNHCFKTLVGHRTEVTLNLLI